MSGFNEAASERGGERGAACAARERSTHASTKPPLNEAENSASGSFISRAMATLQRSRL